MRSRVGHALVQARSGTRVIILAIETATERVSVALGGHDGILALAEVDRGRRHAENLMPAVEFVFGTSGVDRRDVDAIAVDVGPGLFTGMRVGIATAKAVAAALEVPVVTATSLELVAAPFAESDDPVLAVVDARKGEVFSALFRRRDGDFRAVDEARCGSIDDLVESVRERGQVVTCAGDGAIRYREVLAEESLFRVAGPEFAHPSASTLVRIAHRRAMKEIWSEPDRVEAVYLRRPDAEINWQTRASS